MPKVDLVKYEELAKDRAIILNSDGLPVKATDDPATYLANTSKIPWIRDLVDADMPVDEKIKLICDRYGSFVIWSDRYIGSPNLDQASVLTTLHNEHLYTGYVPVIATIDWQVYDDSLDVDFTSVTECVDVRPILDTFDQTRVNEWTDPDAFDDYEVFDEIVGIGADGYLLQSSNPVSSWNGPYEVYLSVSLSEYATDLRPASFSPADVAAAKKHLNDLTLEAIDRIENKLDETRQRILIENALEEKR